MRVNVLGELRQPIGSTTTIEIDDPSRRRDDAEVSGVKGTAVLLRTDRGLLVDFQGRGVASLICSRCLKPMESELTIAFKEEYVPVFDPLTGARVRSGFEFDSFRIAPDFTLDLQEGIRQYLLMSEVAKPLCRPDCAGLCVQCGGDLNDGPCSCSG
jgi:uncharacterized protein